MNILMVSSEVSPFAKSGGLADAVAALGKSLKEKGNCVKTIIPRYYGINRDELELCKKDVCIKMFWKDIYVDFYKSGDIYFVDCEEFFGRDGIYSDCYGDFQDNPKRFAFFARAVFAFCRAMNWIPDIIHSHDWAACITPVLLKFMEYADFSHTKSVLTIHNQGYQGAFDSSCYGMLGLPDEIRTVSGLQRYDGINFLQAGILCSDVVTTVSETYAKEIQTEEQGFGLDGILRVLNGRVSGIVNGADLTEWNPAVDKYIPARYSVNDMSGKAVCKAALQRKFGLEVNPDIPLIGMVGRLVSQKGIDAVFAPNYGCMYRICRELKVQVVLVGTGEKWCQNEVRHLSEVLPNFSGYIGYCEELSHLVESGSDYFLMPSRYEPCGLNQIYSQLYGTLPIVRCTGGLADTVENFDEKTGKGTGFSFYDLTPDAIFNTVKWALSFYKDKAVIKKIQKAGMSKDFSWNKSAEKYLCLYRKILEIEK